MLFPKHFTSRADCADSALANNTALLKTARERGQIVPEVIDGKQGSFTVRGAQRTAYLVRVGECGASMRAYWGTYRLAVFAGPTLVSSSDSPGDAIAAIADVDTNRIDEILISGCGF